MTRASLALPLAFASLGALLGADSGYAPVGKAASVKNIATIGSPATAPARLRANAPVHQRDVIGTGAKSAAGIRLVDGTLFSIGANARVSIDDFVYDADRSASRMTINFLKGAFRFVSGKPTHAYPGQTAIKTPAGSIGIRGTVVTGVIGPEALGYYREADPALGQQDQADDSATLIILSDAGEAGGGIDITAGGVVTSLRRAGQALYFPRPGSPPRPPFMIAPDLRGRIERGSEPRNFSRNQGAPQPPAARPPAGQGNRNPQGNAGPGGGIDGPRVGGGAPTGPMSGPMPGPAPRPR